MVPILENDGLYKGFFRIIPLVAFSAPVTSSAYGIFSRDPNIVPSPPCLPHVSLDVGSGVGVNSFPRSINTGLMINTNRRGHPAV